SLVRVHAVERIADTLHESSRRRRAGRITAKLRQIRRSIEIPALVVENSVLKGDRRDAPRGRAEKGFFQPFVVTEQEDAGLDDRPSERSLIQVVPKRRLLDSLAV